MVRARDNREPRGPPTPSPTPRVLKCRALLYTGENLLLRSGKLRKREHLFSVSYLCSLSSPAPGLCSPLSRLVHPFLFHFSSPCLPPAPVFASLSRPRASFLSLSLSWFNSCCFLTKFHAFVSLPLSLSSCARACFLKEGIWVSTFRQFIFCTELERSQSAFLWSRASGNAVATRTAILR